MESINIKFANEQDVEELKNLLNSAYRGESSKKGWTTEAHLIAGNVRVNNEMLLEALQQKGSVILKYVNEQNKIIGCVNLQQHDFKIYLGMFSVDPLMQASGIGKQILKASEHYAKSVNCNYIYMTVISLRKELIDWYKRNGYVETGETKPFVEDGITGPHLQSLDFIYLQKQF